MKQKKWIAYLDLLGLPEGLPFVLFCSLLGSLITEASHFFIIALSFASNLFIYCFAQIYKHVNNAPEDAVSPSQADRNPISCGFMNIHSARIGLYMALLMVLMSAFLLGLINIVISFSAILLTFALFHPNIRLSNRFMLGFNQHHFLYAGVFFLNSVFANQPEPKATEILFPLIFVMTFYLLYRVEEVKKSLAQPQTTTFWRIVLTSLLIISALITFILIKPFPIWIIALWIFLAAVQLSIIHASQSESIPDQLLYLLKIFQVSGVIAFLVYSIFVFFITYIN